MLIQKATLTELEPLTELFDLYRMFYKQESDLEGAKQFLSERISKDESAAFIALDGENPLGFVQLYPSFSSVSMKRSWILNDLYVKKEARGKGVGENLLKKAIEFAKETGAKGLFLETANDNYNAQRLYEKIGFKKEENYFYYYSI
ncbi:GNAT family N-acetyltransferase [Bacillus sp. AFS076308]|uniref:GNAT family N-acetyltransferase n=1 Tax=unclassified Bacillus (in: firmicutes) TaxID=185979 RepID=UPI000BF9B9F7|nr:MULTISPECIES: GNAT family N-acetyltransferase [unclassified Bacillus (in: firmicutes)]PFN74826.1 GNAT family N-acetyltransferase [Bacillus sp. AFS076308]PGV46590.1 GNAT family N-acetyltransferase [Bacillus sp. AFS037270]